MKLLKIVSVKFVWDLNGILKMTSIVLNQYQPWLKKCETSEKLYITTDYEDHLNFKEDIETEQEQQSKVKMKCNSYDRKVSRKKLGTT